MRHDPAERASSQDTAPLDPELSSELLENEHPGKVLKEEFLDEMGLTAYKLAKGTGLSPIHVSEILRGQRSITPTTSLLLGKFFGMSNRFWLNMQNRYDIIEAERNNAERIEKATYYADLVSA